EKDVNLTMNLMKPYKNDKMPYYTSHRKFYIRNVLIDTNYDPADAYVPSDTITWKGMRIISRAAHYLDEKDVEECCFIKPGKQYKSQNVNRTYQAFGRWDVLKFVNIELTPVGEFDGKVWLDAFVMLTKTKTHNVSLSLEGTNSEGDLGFGVGLGYQHRNLFGGSEAFRAKFRANYESISGDLSGLINDNYSEYSIETGIKFPKFKAPFLKERFKRKILASTELAVNFNYQTRPEYTRIIFGAGWKYIWSPRRKSERHTFSLIDVNYVYLPYSKNGFLDQITNPLLRYSYENHLIMRIGYNLYMSNKPSASTKKVFIPNVYTLRAGVETSGNLLYAISNIIRQKRSDGGYKVFGTRYAQYVKLDADYSLTHYFSERGSLAFHVGGGVVVPYGNSSVAPFEKRFYAGGANGVRGWAVRTLGPGCYNSSNTVNSFIYQCGDIRMDMNLEFRAKLFWVIEMAAFVDAGNIWTMREYDDQVGGVFKFNTFYKQIAMAYGLGIRLNFNYFLLRFDLGMKAHNPAIGQEEWPLVHPNWKRDSQFHFSVGYPF
ncbi:MAG: BamA/TamA family outer membrane protein, partial [Muribaculaceae bacterium]|nr:BamA/TamA family outer membrane protein [Muribaculaceae bacterium]